VKEELTGRRVARRVLTAEAEVQVAERNPARLAAPPYMDQTLPVRQHAREFDASSRGHGALGRAVNANGPATMRISATVADHRLFQPATAGQAAGFGVAHDATLARLGWPAWASR
jgi:hypothetical protein